VYLDENGDPDLENGDATPSKRWRDFNDNSLTRLPLSPRKDIDDMVNGCRSPLKRNTPSKLAVSSRSLFEDRTSHSPQALSKENG
jgi:hypothetical protein